jgi:anti-anti-sigma regulatory factor
MKWRRARGQETATAVREPLILAIDEAVTRDSADGIVALLGRMAVANSVIIDLTAIPEFDSDGAAALLSLQERLGPDRLTIVGFRQATARLLGSDDVDAPPPVVEPAGSPWVVRRLRAIAVVQAADDRPANIDALEPALTSAIEEAVGIVVLDLRGLRMSRQGVQTIAFASSAAALRGQELLVVNVDADTGERLRRAGLSATTYVAPEPLIDS